MKTGEDHRKQVEWLANNTHDRREANVKSVMSGLEMKDREAVKDRIRGLADDLAAIEYELQMTVGAARATIDGLSWAEVGEAYGDITKQGAAKRFKDAASVYGEALESGRRHAEDTTAKNLHRRLGLVRRRPSTSS